MFLLNHAISHQVNVWLLRTGEDGEIPIILYSYTPTRAGKNAAALLKDAPPGFFS